MISSADLRLLQEYECRQVINLYKTSACHSLVTQAAPHRHLRFLDFPATATSAIALPVLLVEDDYPGWISIATLTGLAPAPVPYSPPCPSAASIRDRISDIIAFTEKAMRHPNEYCWGGTVAPNYDCSGLIQAAYASVHICIPRDSYQQEAFATPVRLEAIERGDLLFFGTPARTTHVALFLGAGSYIHSSGKQQGRNGIGIDSITDLSHPVSHTYFAQLRGAGRITQSYQPQGVPLIHLEAT
jgi:hypothetical protein